MCNVKLLVCISLVVVAVQATGRKEPEKGKQNAKANSGTGPVKPQTHGKQHQAYIDCKITEIEQSCLAAYRATHKGQGSHQKLASNENKKPTTNVKLSKPKSKRSVVTTLKPKAPAFDACKLTLQKQACIINYKKGHAGHGSGSSEEHNPSATVPTTTTTTTIPTTTTTTTVPTTTTTTTVTTTTTTDLVRCLDGNGGGLDIMLIVDSSSSINRLRFTNMLKPWLITFLSQFDFRVDVVGNAASRVAYVDFSTIAQTIFGFTSYTSATAMSDITAVINALPWAHGVTNTVAGMDMATTLLNQLISTVPPSTIPRRRVAILITDGAPDPSTRPLASSVSDLTTAVGGAAHFFGVVVGDALLIQDVVIPANTIPLTDYSLLSTITDSLKTSICSAV